MIKQLLLATACAFAFGMAIGPAPATEIDPVDDLAYMIAVDSITQRHCTDHERAPLVQVINDTPAIDVVPPAENVAVYVAVLEHVFQAAFNETDMTDMALELAEKGVCLALIAEASAQ